jgi:hypothetical protein
MPESAFARSKGVRTSGLERSAITVAMNYS